MKESNNPKHNLLSITVEGKRFFFRADSTFAERAHELGKEAERRAMLAAAQNRHDPEGTASFLRRAINTLMEDDVTDQVFPDQEGDILDLLDLLERIMDAFHTYRACRIAKLKEGIA